MIGKFIGALTGGKIFIGLALLGLAGTVYASKLYLDKRDEAVGLERAYLEQQALAQRWRADLSMEQERARLLELERISLVSRNAELSNQEAEVVVEIHERWRDRIVAEEFPVAVDCAAEPHPPFVGELLRCTAAGRDCTPADLSPDPAGSSSTL